MKTHRLFAVILIAHLAAGVFAQQPRRPPLETSPPARQTTQPQKQPPQKPDEEDVVRITTNLVQVDAVVTDKNGRVVTDLKPEEIQISEDGKPQKITNLSYVVTETPAATNSVAKPPTTDKNAPPVPSARLKPEDVRRTIAVVVDDLGLSFESIYYARRALKKFVDEQMQTGDLVAIIRTSGGMGALQQFTSDKRQLYAAIERVKWYANGRGNVGAFAPLAGNDQSNVAGNSRDNQDNGSPAEDLDQFREDVFAVGTLGALSYVVRGLRELPGRKSVLLVSDGIKIFNRDDPTRSNRVLEALRRLTDQANRASVVVYTMDARGLQVLGLTAADDTSGFNPQQLEQQMSNRRADFFESQNGLNYLAQQTGGLAIRNSNDLAAGIKRVLDDQKGYYLIGYRPDESTFDQRTGRRKFHHLSLKITRPGKFNVRMRNGFFGVTDEELTPPQTPAQKMIGALVSPFGSSGVHLQLTSLFGNDAKAGSIMRSMLHIDARDLTFADEPDGWHKSVFDIIAVTFGDNGVPVDQVNRTHTVRIRGETYKRVLRDGFVYVVTVPLKKPGAYQLRVALRDTDSERIGSASQFVDVPDIKKNRLALSTIIVRGLTAAEFARNKAPMKSPGDNASAPSTQSNAATPQSEGVEEGDAQASAAVRHFHSGLVMEYGYMIFNAQLSKATNQPQLTTQVRLVRDGKVIFNGKEIPFDTTNQTDLKRLAAGGAIQLGTGLGPGEYALQIIVNDALANEKRRTATQWIDFEIVK
ncbi:MAG TPA: VWA domain-containing protein [Pyrinomonadaceae bacterium]|nr:VWA domain-containing protein [Pyrinomonadaceae bacterium]